MAELAWPEDLGHGTFIGRFGFMDADSHDPDREPDITSATGGTVTITPSVKSVRYKGTDGPIILAARSAKGVIDAEGYLCTMNAEGAAGDRGMVFPATDDTDLTPTDWTYEVSIVLDGQVRIPAFHVKLPEGSTVDLSLAAPVPASGGTAVVVDPSTAERAENAATRAEAAADAAEDWAPTFEWDGTYLVVDGVRSPSLKGEKGDAPTWEDLPGKPTSFPSTIPDVQGLTARLAALEYNSGWRVLTSWDGSGTRVGNWTFPSGVAPTPGSSGSVRIRRVGRRVEWLFHGCSWTSSAVLFNTEIPTGFRTGDTEWVATVLVGLNPADFGALRRRTWGFYINDASGKTSHTTYGTHFGYEVSEPIPTTLPGDPA